jgi:hypothetical protein
MRDKFPHWLLGRGRGRCAPASGAEKRAEYGGKDRDAERVVRARHRRSPGTVRRRCGEGQRSPDCARFWSRNVLRPAYSILCAAEKVPSTAYSILCRTGREASTAYSCHEMSDAGASTPYLGHEMSDSGASTPYLSHGRFGNGTSTPYLDLANSRNVSSTLYAGHFRSKNARRTGV